MASKLIVRVDDVGQDLDQSRPDVGLAYFKRWASSGDWWDGVPLYLGVVPAAVSEPDMRWLTQESERRGWELCIHGWDHARQPLTRGHVERARGAMPSARCVIPPYNAYDQDTVRACAELIPGCVLFGGFHREHHQYGDAPTVVEHVVLHLSADRSLYDRCWPLSLRLPMMSEYPDWPRVVTLHHRWDADRLGGVRDLYLAARDRACTVEEAWDYARQAC